MNNIVKPIKSEKDYTEALDFIDAYFDASEETEEANIRDVLVTLVEKYEGEISPIDFPDPVAAIKFRMDQEGLTQKDLIPMIGSRSKVSEVLSGKRELSLKMIRAINQHLGISADILLQHKSITNLEEDSDINYESFPISEMKKHGAFDGINIGKKKDNAEELILNLRKKIGIGFAIPELKYRISKSTRLNAKINNYALQGWILHLLHNASKVDMKKNINKEDIDESFLSSLVNLSILEEGPKLAQEFLQKHGIILTYLHHYKNTYLDGAAYISSEGIPIIGLTLRFDRIDNFWFNLLHEIGHIKLHLDAGNYIADDMSLRGSQEDDQIEKEADKFAEKALFPSDFNQIKDKITSQKDVCSYSLKHNIHPAIVAGRIQFITNNYRIYSNLVGRGEVRKCFNS